VNAQFPDPRVPVFFLSYARTGSTGHPANRAAREFFDEVRQNVAQLVPSHPGHEIGFMDTSNMKAGTVWGQEVLEAAATCQVFVALLSPAYMWHSHWCAMEWDMFAARKVRRRSDGKLARSTAILPVLWVPAQEKMPDRIHAIQRFTPPEINKGSVALYGEHGVFGLVQMRLTDEVSTICWTLAQRIAETHAELRVDRHPDPDPGTLRRSFEEES
jgi:hypothetical protein